MSAPSPLSVVIVDDDGVRGPIAAHDTGGAR